MKKKMVCFATVLTMMSGSALSADMLVKAVKAPPPSAFNPWDVAFGSSIMNDYIFRGITQSNNKPSVAAYLEPRYNVTKNVQLYLGLASESISPLQFLGSESASFLFAGRIKDCATTEVFPLSS